MYNYQNESFGEKHASKIAVAIIILILTILIAPMFICIYRDLQQEVTTEEYQQLMQYNDKHNKPKCIQDALHDGKVSKGELYEIHDTLNAIQQNEEKLKRNEIRNQLIQQTNQPFQIKLDD